MSRFDYEDRLELLGIPAGAFLILAALGTLVGMPWATNDETIAVLIQMIGIVATLAVGVALIAITYREDPRTLLPDGK